MKKICPICDMSLSAGSYCPRCKKIIKNPYLINSDFYLNESRPYGKAADAENQAASRRERSEKPKSTKTEEKSGSLPAAAKPAKTKAQKDTLKREIQQNPVKTSEHNSNSTRGIKTAVIIILAAVVVCIVAGAYCVWQVYDLQGYGIPEYDFQSEETWDDSYDEYQQDYEVTEYSEEEVVLLGEACTGYDHFPVDGSLLGEQLMAFAQERNYKACWEETYSDNYSIKDDYGEYSYFDTWKTIYLQRQDQPGYEDYLYLGYDTATGQLHYYQSIMDSSSDSLGFLEVFLLAAEEQGGIQGGSSQTESIMTEISRLLETETESYVSAGMFHISVYTDDEETSVYVSYREPEV
ncbi:MAG TPA: hypothetical protein H9740_12570 [Candidatus Hungatella pullicola]|nr:hypothetical protein [Candidatus Hungatella pullicola]